MSDMARLECSYDLIIISNLTWNPPSIRVWGGGGGGAPKIIFFGFFLSTCAYLNVRTKFLLPSLIRRYFSGHRQCGWTVIIKLPQLKLSFAKTELGNNIK